MRRFLWPVVASLGFIAVVFLFVLPTRTYLDQHRSVDQVNHQIATLTQQNRQLEKQAASLQNQANIARIAHHDYGLVKAGQQATVVLPSPHSTQAASSSTNAGSGHHEASGRGGRRSSSQHSRGASSSTTTSTTS